MMTLSSKRKGERKRKRNFFLNSAQNYILLGLQENGNILINIFLGDIESKYPWVLF